MRCGGVNQGSPVSLAMSLSRVHTSIADVASRPLVGSADKHTVFQNESQHEADRQHDAPRAWEATGASSHHQGREQAAPQRAPSLHTRPRLSSTRLRIRHSNAKAEVLRTNVDAFALAAGNASRRLITCTFATRINHQLPWTFSQNSEKKENPTDFHVGAAAELHRIHDGTRVLVHLPIETHALVQDQRKLQPKQASEREGTEMGNEGEKSLRRPGSSRAADGSAPRTQCCPKRTALRRRRQQSTAR